MSQVVPYSYPVVSGKAVGPFAHAYTISATTTHTSSSNSTRAPHSSDPTSAAATAKLSKAAKLLREWELSDADLVLGNAIGEGGQATVFHGRWRGIEVAAKQPRIMLNRKQTIAPLGATASGSGDQSFDVSPYALESAMVRREMRALGRVRHPNVVRLYGACFSSIPTVVMAYAANGTLQDAIESHRFQATAEVTRLLAGIARPAPCPLTPDH